MVNVTIYIYIAYLDPMGTGLFIYVCGYFYVAKKIVKVGLFHGLRKLVLKGH